MASVQPELKRRPHAIFLAKALSVDPEARKVSCIDDGESNFEVDYDILAIATGSQACLICLRGVLFPQMSVQYILHTLYVF